MGHHSFVPPHACVRIALLTSSVSGDPAIGESVAHAMVMTLTLATVNKNSSFVPFIVFILAHLWTYIGLLVVVVV